MADKRIVVGVDGSPSSMKALHWAIGQAKLTGAEVEAHAQVGGIAPDVVVEPLVVQGHAADVLVRAAEGADLLVVGSRGHGGFAEMLLGSVSQHCVHHAPCPVLILRDGR